MEFGISYTPHYFLHPVIVTYDLYNLYDLFSIILASGKYNIC